MNDTDVLLINPVDDTAVKNGLGVKAPPLSLMYLAAVLEKESMNVKIIDDDMYHAGASKIADIASKINPPVVGVTATTATIKNALGYISSIKDVLPNTLTVIGGPHPTFLPEETLQSEEGLDVIVIGEGEKTLVDIAQKYDKTENSNELSEIKGITYKENNKIRSTPPRPTIKHLDEMPFPARHLLPFKNYVDSGHAGALITSRGCVFSCNYCSSSLIMGKKFRTRSPENVVDEIEELFYKYGVREMAFIDDIFMLNKRRAMEIADEIRNRGLDINFVTSSRVDTVNRELLESLKKSGMSTLYCGVESGSQRVLDLMGKGITLKQIEDAMKIIKDVDIATIASFIIGYPGETEEEIDQTIHFSIKLEPDYTQYSILTPFPGTSIYYELKQKGLIDTESWDKYTALKSVINYEKLGLSKKLVERKLTKAYLKFYTRPRYIFEHRFMLGVLIKTIFRSYVMPKLRGKTPEGAYKPLN
jgi:anaerobic magnesium-protoporphyrin IX monomethyl ester cyclase